jgi:hypothetical protein
MKAVNILTPNGEAALRLAALGLRVFSCWEGDKKPAIATHSGAKRRENGSCTHCGSNSIFSRGGKLCR